MWTLLSEINMFDLIWFENGLLAALVQDKFKTMLRTFDVSFALPNKSLSFRPKRVFLQN